MENQNYNNNSSKKDDGFCCCCCFLLYSTCRAPLKVKFRQTTCGCRYADDDDGSGWQQRQRQQKAFFSANSDFDLGAVVALRMREEGPFLPSSPNTGTS